MLTVGGKTWYHGLWLCHFGRVSFYVNCLGARRTEISTSNYRINEQIRVKEVRLINADGENIGVVSINEALQAAYEAGMDLVEIAPKADPPVCRVIDYGKFMYERTKKEKEAR